MIPYGKQTIEEDDIAAVVDVLRSDWLTTGPKVAEFEKLFAEFCGVSHAIAVSNGTAALHAAMAGLQIGPGDEVIIPAITFVATANAAVYLGAKPVFADIDPDTLLIDPCSVERYISSRTKLIAAVDYAGQPCGYTALRRIADAHGISLLADACHALGASYQGRPVGSCTDISTFSLHPVKPITTGEGGVVVTDDAMLAARVRTFRSHGITSDFRQRESQSSWVYEMVSLGYNYRLPDLSCALGITQLQKLPVWIARRNEIATRYNEAFAADSLVRPLVARQDRTHGYHLYVVRVASDRDETFRQLRAKGIGVNVHYMPVYLHPFYRERLGYSEGLCPDAEREFRSILSLPIYPRMTNEMVEEVVTAVRCVVHSLA